MPPIVADPVITFLRPRGDAEEYGNQPDYRRPPWHENFPQGTRTYPPRRLVHDVTRSPLRRSARDPINAFPRGVGFTGFWICRMTGFPVSSAAVLDLLLQV